MTSLRKRADAESCWLWTASTDKDGYGQIGEGPSGGTMLKAHRLSWEFVNGPVPPGQGVLHRCDNPPCVNPGHLFAGTDQDNKDDMNRKGRNAFQLHNPSRKLTDAQVLEIRRRRSSGELLTGIAKAFGVAASTVSRIAHGVRRDGVVT